MIKDPRTVGCSSGDGGKCPDRMAALGREPCGLCHLTCDRSTMPPASPTHPRAAGGSSEICKHVLHTRSLRDTVDSGRAPSVMQLLPYKQETSCSNTNHSSQILITSFQPRRKQGPRSCLS